VSSGVREGSVLEPLLCNVSVHILPNTIKYSRYLSLILADDIKIFPDVILDSKPFSHHADQTGCIYNAFTNFKGWVSHKIGKISYKRIAGYGWLLSLIEKLHYNKYLKCAIFYLQMTQFVYITRFSLINVVFLLLIKS